jgi:hypothetical protein
MEITPLALVVLLGFGLLVALCLTAWTALSLDRAAGADRGAERATPGRQAGRATTNDEVRGARSRAERLTERGGKNAPEDAAAEQATGLGGERVRVAARQAEQQWTSSGAGAVQLSGGGSWRSVDARETAKPGASGRKPARPDADGRKTAGPDTSGRQGQTPGGRETAGPDSGGREKPRAASGERETAGPASGERETTSRATGRAAGRGGEISGRDGGKRAEAGKEQSGREEDAFERFLRARPDDFDIR